MNTMPQRPTVKPDTKLLNEEVSEDAHEAWLIHEEEPEENKDELQEVIREVYDESPYLSGLRNKARALIQQAEQCHELSESAETVQYS